MHLPSEQNYLQQLSIDCIIFGYRDSQLSVLVPKLNFKGDFWAFDSGLLDCFRRLQNKYWLASSLHNIC